MKLQIVKNRLKVLDLFTSIEKERGKTQCTEKNFSKCVVSNPQAFVYPLATGRKLNVHKTFRRRFGRLPNVSFKFNLHRMFRAESKKVFNKSRIGLLARYGNLLSSS